MQWVRVFIYNLIYVYTHCYQSVCVDLVNMPTYVPAERIGQTVSITKHTISIEEKGIKLRLTIMDTPGFGDAVNNTER